jgi:hypothetical protein
VTLLVSILLTYGALFVVSYSRMEAADAERKNLG